jgi:L-seryl-tRNA(Ser) seleniumtransferase
MGPGDQAGHAGELSGLPAVHELVEALGAVPHGLAVTAARRAVEQHRAAIRAGSAPLEDVLHTARAQLEALTRPSLRRVLNATGVIIHTNLGRAPLPQAARRALEAAAEGYSNLELDLDSGTRGSRHGHVEALLCELTRAGGAMVVNNGAAAVLLAAASLGAGPERVIIVSRGQLVEIGGGFRIPDVIAQSGSRLIEVGTTNRTRRSDYRAALEAHPDAVILRVHQSNFRTVGFVADVEIEDLCALGAPVIDDVGSGVLADANGIPALGEEPSLKRSVAAGAALVCCSGDKLLGGPQAGILIGTAAAISTARQHPLARALRIDKLSLAALAATLMLYRDPADARSQIPVLAMLDQTEQALTHRAELLRQAIGPTHASIVRAAAKVGGGALPLCELEGPVVAIADTDRSPQALATQLRRGEPPVIGRIHDGRLILDPRTLTDAEAGEAGAAVAQALG